MARREDAPYADYGDEHGDEYPGDYTDDYADRYRDHHENPSGYRAEPAASARRPWHRNPIVLLGLIAAASVALATAAVLLLTSAGSDESPARLRPTIRTTAASVAPSQRVPRTSPTSRSAETTPATSGGSVSPDAESTAAESPAAPTEAPARPPSAPTAGPGEPNGPRINVTRSPMSFTPGSRG